MWRHSAEAKLLKQKHGVRNSQNISTSIFTTIPYINVHLWNILLNVAYGPVIAFCRHMKLRFSQKNSRNLPTSRATTVFSLTLLHEGCERLKPAFVFLNSTQEENAKTHLTITYLYIHRKSTICKI
jgi:hypothetical protein